MAPKETANNAYATFWSDQQTVLWHVMVKWSIDVDCIKVAKHLPNLFNANWF